MRWEVDDAFHPRIRVVDVFSVQVLAGLLHTRHVRHGAVHELPRAGVLFLLAFEDHVVHFAPNDAPRALSVRREHATQTRCIVIHLVVDVVVVVVVATRVVARRVVLRVGSRPLKIDLVLRRSHEQQTALRALFPLLSLLQNGLQDGVEGVARRHVQGDLLRRLRVAARCRVCSDRRQHGAVAQRRVGERMLAGG